MLIPGCCADDCSERGAFGFSNEKSLMYWAVRLRLGMAPVCAGGTPPSGCGPPLVGFAMSFYVLLHPWNVSQSARVANTGPGGEQGSPSSRLRPFATRRDPCL